MEDVQVDTAPKLVPTTDQLAVTKPIAAPNASAPTFAEEAPNPETAAENKEWFEANSGGAFVKAVGRSFLHGDNIAVNVGKSLARAWETGDEDPSWDRTARETWIEQNKKDIPETQLYRYWGTRSKSDADLLKQQQVADHNEQKINSKVTGIAGIAAPLVAGIIDIDTPLTLMTGGLSLEAKAGLSTISRMARGGVSGAALGIGMGVTDYVVNPNAEAESIAMFGLMGAGFGVIGAGVAGKHAGTDLTHATKQEAIEELGERLNNTGRDLPAEPIPAAHPDPYRISTPAPVDGEPVIQRPAGSPSAEPGAPVAVRLEGMPDGAGEVASAAPTPRAVRMDEANGRVISEDLAVPQEQTRGPVLAKPGDVIEEVKPVGEATRGPVLARSADDIIEAEKADLGGETKGPYVAKAGDVVGEGSLGAKGPARPGFEGIENPQYKEIAWQAKQDNARNRLNDVDDPEWNRKNAVTEAMGKAADRFSRFAQKLGITTDWDNFMRSELHTARKFAFDMFESAAGIARNYTSASALQEVYRKELGGTFVPFLQHQRDYNAQVHGTGRFAEYFTDAGQKATDDFNRQVVAELMSRQYGGQGATHKSVKAAADIVDKTFALELQVAQGRNGQLGIAAYKDLKEKSGYFPQKWSGENMLRMLDNAEAKRGLSARKEMKTAIRKAIEDDYARMHPLMKPDDRRIYAQAVVDRALINRESIGRDILGLLSGDERDFVKSAFMRNGKSEAEADRIIDSLIGSRESKGRPGQTQERIDVDFRSTSNGINMMDLLDTDVFGIVHKRIARTSGLAAMARKGITSRADFEAVKGAALAEQEARRAAGGARPTGVLNSLKQVANMPTELDGKYWDDVYSYFSGSAVAGGVSPVYARLKKLTSLATMNQLGLTSLSETGAIMGTVGWQHFRQHAGQWLKEATGAAESPLNQEMRHMHVFVPEEAIWRPDMVFESEKVKAEGELMQKADMLLNKGARVQGYLSGFFQVRNAQQKIAITSATARTFEGMKSGKDRFSHERLHDMGLDVKNWQKYIDDGTVQFDQNGSLVKLNLDKWKYDDVEMYRASMARVTNQLIQKAMAGESNVMFHRDGMAQLFWQFKSFPLLAVEKQFNRNMRMADSAALQTFYFGLMTAGVAYAGKQAINGNTDNLTASKIARGAFGYSNLSGWLPMWTDPVMGMMGLGDYNLSGYSGRQGGSVISTPPVFSVLDKLLQAPGSLARVATPGLEYTNSDIRNLQTIPIIGNLYGSMFLTNTMKHDTKRKPPKAKLEKALAPVEDKIKKAFNPAEAGKAAVEDLEIAN